jgi:isopenicillin-N N-acyltransferase-like protein
MTTRLIPFFLFLFFIAFPVFSEVLSKQGSGYLEQHSGQLVLHLKGTPYQRGFQHGSMLKEQIQRNISTYIDQAKSPIPGRVDEFIRNMPVLMSFVPDHFKQEIKGLSDGSDIPIEKIIALNLFPEMFHCSGITVSGEASQNAELYHVRVLDYSIGKNLQSTAVLQVVEPENKIPYLNISYAGFIGTVTGMNNQKIAIGEIGGLGYGSWQGIPMAFLLREILESASSIEEAKSILQTAPRTYEYYYVFSDGKTGESIGAYATASQLRYFAPGDSYALIAPSQLPANYSPNGDHDKFILHGCHAQTTPYQTLLFENDNRLAMLFRLQPPACLLLTGFSHPERYPVLVSRILENYGAIDEKILIDIIKRPVARDSNLHNAIFKPSELKVWIAHAGPNDEPACDQSYQEWDFSSLLKPKIGD